MSDNLTAEIVAIGTEILLGEITDTNSVFIARSLRDLGINVFYMTSVGDNVSRIASALQIAMSRADIIITCGGLGPTIDDMTRQGVAKATERELVFDERLYQQIIDRFAGFGVRMSENNKRQAYLPENAIAIDNPVGTAPSFITQHKGKVIITLPGVPRELKYLFNEAVMPYLQRQYQLGLIRARILRVAGIGESALDEMIGVELLEGSNPTIGLAAHHGIIDVRLTAKGQTSTEVDAMLDGYEQAVMEKIGDFVFGHDKDTIEGVLINRLKATGKRVAVIEAGIDAIVSKLKNHPLRSEIADKLETFATPEEMYRQFEKPSDTTPREFAGFLAHELAENADFAIVIISDPTVDENADSEQATVIAVSGNEQVQSRAYGFGAKSELAQGWVSRWGLASVWRMTKGL
jgi:nicotinamide-nucleotide amidase